MPIDEQTQAFIKQSNQTPRPPLDTLPIETIRAAAAALRQFGFDHEEVGEVLDATVAREGHPPVPVRLYIPDVSGRPPLVLWAHGGSWVRLSVDAMDEFFRVLANRSGCAIGAVEFQLAPEATFPVAIEEIYEVGRWARKNADGFGLDADRIGIGGESSGGNLAAAVTLLARDRGEFQFAHQTLVQPALDVRCVSASWAELGTDYLLTTEQAAWAVRTYAPGVPSDKPLLSPLLAGRHDELPPALIVTGEYDPLRDEGEAYAAALDVAGVPVRHVRYLGLIHHSIMVPKVIELGRRMVEETAAAFGDALRAASR